MGKGKYIRDQLERENDKNTDKMRIVEGFDEAIKGYSDSWNGAPNGKSRVYSWMSAQGCL